MRFPLLRSADLSNLERVLRAAESECSLVALEKYALSAMRSLIACEIVTCERWQKNLQGFYTFIASGTFEQEFTPYWESFLHTVDSHPIMKEPSAKQNLAEEVFILNDYLPPSHFKNAAIYHDMYRHFGIDVQLGAQIASLSSYELVMTVDRTKRIFSDREKELFLAFKFGILSIFKKNALILFKKKIFFFLSCHA